MSDKTPDLASMFVDASILKTKTTKKTTAQSKVRADLYSTLQVLSENLSLFTDEEGKGRAYPYSVDAKYADAKKNAYKGKDADTIARNLTSLAFNLAKGIVKDNPDEDAEAIVNLFTLNYVSPDTILITLA